MKNILIATLIIGTLLVQKANAEIKTYDLEVQTLSEDTDNNLTQRIQIRPSVTFTLTERISLQIGAILRFEQNDNPDRYGVYFRVSCKPDHKKEKASESTSH